MAKSTRYGGGTTNTANSIPAANAPLLQGRHLKVLDGAVEGLAELDREPRIAGLTLSAHLAASTEFTATFAPAIVIATVGDLPAGTAANTIVVVKG